jgi:hypothetical protein
MQQAWPRATSILLPPRISGLDLLWEYDRYGLIGLLFASLLMGYCKTIARLF